MTKKERESKIKRIENALKTIDEVQGDFWEVLSFEQRCDLRSAKRPLKFALKFHKA